MYSVAGMLRPGVAFVRERPYRAPHHTASAVGLVGGGDPPRPGEIALAHHGVLFLDELPEFPRESLEALREPLEEGHVTIVRARNRATYPARFTLVAAMNPCPCGWHGDPSDRCDCGEERVRRYRARVSGPLLDRIDLYVALPPAHVTGLDEAPTGPSMREQSSRRVVRRFLDEGVEYPRGCSGASSTRRRVTPKAPLHLLDEGSAYVADVGRVARAPLATTPPRRARGAHRVRARRCPRSRRGHHRRRHARSLAHRRRHRGLRRRRAALTRLLSASSASATRAGTATTRARSPPRCRS